MPNAVRIINGLTLEKLWCNLRNVAANVRRAAVRCAQHRRPRAPAPPAPPLPPPTARRTCGRSTPACKRLSTETRNNTSISVRATPRLATFNRSHRRQPSPTPPPLPPTRTCWARISMPNGAKLDIILYYYLLFSKSKQHATRIFNCFFDVHQKCDGFTTID